ncbi:hypothetical protein AY599_13810 [Leptolyngbya valderiana BDU 20041]|nr:hypothetical protein AY599_13810 [Leptolyngbya valderiana BDU 20041]PPT07301.1 diguanylate cyclase/phosphodiesterase (GGDEF & EAL domains) with PAS/PAC sensor(s) [Geitlerinema sp. FC II]
MNSRRRPQLLVLDLTLVSLIAIGGGGAFCFRAAMERERTHLSQIARDRIRLVSAISRETGNRDDTLARVSTQLAVPPSEEAGDRADKPPSSPNTALVRRDNGIVWLFDRSIRPEIAIADLQNGEFLPVDRVLEGNSGTAIARTPNGKRVLVAYEPVPNLPWGVVVQVSLAEVRAPFIKVGLYTLTLVLATDILSFLWRRHRENAVVREIQTLNRNLETKVRQRTTELTQLNQNLQRQVRDRQRIESVLRETTHRLEAILQNVADGIVVFGRYGEIIYANDEAARLAGYEDIEHMIASQRPVSPQCDVLDEAGQIIPRENLPQTAVLEGIASHFQTLRYYNRTTHEERWVFVKATPVSNDDGDFNLAVVVTHDITDRANVEAALRQSEARYRRIVETASDGIWIIDADRVTTFVNPKMAQMLGYPIEDILGRSIFEFMDESDREAAADKLARHHQDTVRQYDLKLRCRDGSQLWTIVSATPAFDMTDGSLGSLGVTIDITERKIAEDALRESEERFRALFEQAAVAMAVMTLDGRFFRVNQAFCELLGYSRPELLELRLGDITHPADLRTTHEKLIGLREGIGDRYSLEKRYLGKTGEIVWVSSTVSIVRDGNGSPKYLLGVVQNISQRKRALRERETAETALRESEKRFRTLVQTAGSAIIALASDRRIVEWNDEAERLCGWTRTEMLGEDYFTLCLPPAWRDRVAAQFDRVLGGQLVREFEHQVFDAQGETREVLWNFNRWYNAQSKQWEIVACGQDITERQQVQAALRESVERFRAIFEQVAVGVAYVSGDGAIVDVNQKYADICGYRQSELRSKSIAAIVHPDDRGDWASWTNRLLGGELDTFSREIRYLRRDRTTIWVNLTASILHDAKGRPENFLHAIENISDRKQAEADLQQANQKLKENLHELELRHEEMVNLSRTNEFLQACASLEEAYDALGDLLRPLFPGCSGGLFLLEGDTELLEPVSVWGLPLEEAMEISSDSCWALRLSRAHWSDRQTKLHCKHLRYPSPPAESLCVPVIAQGETLGLLQIQSPEPGNLTEAKQHLARTVTEHVALTLSNLQLRETLKRQSIRDPLTGLYNRRYLEESLDRELHRASRDDYPLSVVMLDVDRFKKFNDKFGHDAGDAVLQRLGEFLQHQVRGSDVACRYGGEELTLVLPGASLEIARDRAENIRRGIENLHVSSNGRLLGTIRASLGVASFPDCGTTWEEILQAADAALYRSKANGRNRVTVAEPVTG